ncbi:DEAD/DEAH box helicase family protein [Streptomyces albogriseolus]
MIVQTKEEWDVTTGTSVRRTSMLFPRFHQWEAVTSIVEAVKEEGVGQRYLIEHSAGSGKTNTIAWTAHRLARLHVDDRKVFDSVIVIVDRTVLDSQLQDAIRQIDGTGKIVTTISPEDVRKAGAKSKSGLLAQALKNGELIIAVTVQTFPHALNEIRTHAGLKGKKFAVIADEAHSSPVGPDVLKAEAGADGRGGQGDRGGWRGRCGVDPGFGDDRAGRVGEHLLLRLHRDAEEQDAGAVRPQGSRRQAARVPPVLDEAGDRGGLHPRRAQGLPAL